MLRAAPAADANDRPPARGMRVCAGMCRLLPGGNRSALAAHACRRCCRYSSVCPLVPSALHVMPLRVGWRVLPQQAGGCCRSRLEGAAAAGCRCLCLVLCAWHLQHRNSWRDAGRPDIFRQQVAQNGKLDKSQISQTLALYGVTMYNVCQASPPAYLSLALLLPKPPGPERASAGHGTGESRDVFTGHGNAAVAAGGGGRGSAWLLNGELLCEGVGDIGRQVTQALACAANVDRSLLYVISEQVTPGELGEGLRGGKGGAVDGSTRHATADGEATGHGDGNDDTRAGGRPGLDVARSVMGGLTEVYLTIGVSAIDQASTGCGENACAQDVARRVLMAVQGGNQRGTSGQGRASTRRRREGRARQQGARGQGPDARVWVPAARKIGAEGVAGEAGHVRAGDGGGGYVPSAALGAHQEGRPPYPAQVSQVDARDVVQGKEGGGERGEAGKRPSSVPSKRLVPQARLTSAPARGRSTPPSSVEAALSDEDDTPNGAGPVRPRGSASCSPTSPPSFEIYTDDGEEEEDDAWSVEGRRKRLDAAAADGKQLEGDEDEGDDLLLVADIEEDTEDESHEQLAHGEALPGQHGEGGMLGGGSGVPGRTRQALRQGRVGGNGLESDTYGGAVVADANSALLRYVVSCSVYVGRAPPAPALACTGCPQRFGIYSVSSGPDFTAERQHLDRLVYPALQRMLRSCCQVTWCFHEWDGGEAARGDEPEARLQALEQSYLGSHSDPMAAATACIALVGSRPSALLRPHAPAALACLDKGFLWHFDPAKLPEGPALPVARLELELMSGKFGGKRGILKQARHILSLLRSHGGAGVAAGGARRPPGMGALGSRTGHVISLLRSLVTSADTPPGQRGQGEWQGAEFDHGGGKVEHGWSWSELVAGESGAGAPRLEEALSFERIGWVSSRLAQVLPRIAEELSGGGAVASRGAAEVGACQEGGAAAAAAAVAEPRSVSGGVAMADMTQLRRQRLEEICHMSEVLAKLAGSDGDDLREEVAVLAQGMAGGAAADDVVAQADNVLYCLNSLCDAELVPQHASAGVELLVGLLNVKDLLHDHPLASVADAGEGRQSGVGEAGEHGAGDAGAQQGNKDAAGQEQGAQGALVYATRAARPVLEMLPAVPPMLVVTLLRTLQARSPSPPCPLAPRSSPFSFSLSLVRARVVAL